MRGFLVEDGINRNGGFAGLALADLMAESPLSEKRPHFPVKAKHCVFLFMNGGPSQVDTFAELNQLANVVQGIMTTTAGGTASPVFSGCMMSGRPQTALTTTGTPAACACTCPR